MTVPDYPEIDCQDAPAGLEFIAGAGGDCVVKPATGDEWRRRRSPGACATSAPRPRCAERRPLRPRLLIERQIPGDMYRLLFLDGELVDVVLRRAPT